jgi:hypothetical protein
MEAVGLGEHVIPRQAPLDLCRSRQGTRHGQWGLKPDGHDLERPDGKAVAGLRARGFELGGGLFSGGHRQFQIR